MKTWRILSLVLLAVIAAKAASTVDTASHASTRDEVVAIMKQVASWQLAHPRHKDTDWHNGPLFAGILELYKVTNDQTYLETLVRMGEKNQWCPGKRPRHADDHCIGQTYIELYLLKQELRMISAIRQTFDHIMATPKKGREDWWWCDALFMAPPTLVRLTAATGDQKYLDFMNAMWWDATDHLYDSEEHLYYRDKRFFSKREKNNKKVFWSRGNGWVLAGLCRVLQHMPKEYPHRERYVALFKQMTTRIASLQQKDGFWRASLLDPNSYPGGESSGTGFFTYAFAWGINQGLLPREKYLPVAEKGWIALCGAVEGNGKLGWVQQVGDQPQRLRREDSETYGTGAFLLAGCEMARLLKTEQGAEGDAVNRAP